VEFGMALPDALKLRDGRTKHIVKLAAAPLVGRAVTERPKRGFDVPLAAWLRREPLGSWGEHTVLQSRLMRRDIFDADAIRAMFRTHRTGRADYGFRLWNLINLCCWADHWIDGRRV
jgi:asparagine synthase (glutamine-hydrolysing)